MGRHALILALTVAASAPGWAAQPATLGVGSPAAGVAVGGAAVSTVTVNVSSGVFGAADFILNFDTNVANLSAIQAIANEVQGSVYFSTTNFNLGSVRVAAVNGASTQTPTGLLSLLSASYSISTFTNKSSTQLSAQVLTLVDTQPVSFFPISTTTGTVMILGDALPPRTSLLVGLPDFGSNPIYGSSSTLYSFFAVDDRAVIGDGKGVGVAQTFYAIDSTTFSVFTSSFNVPQEGLHSIRWYSTDLVGNTEVVKSTLTATDLTPPITQIQLSSPTFVDSLGRSYVSTTSAVGFTAIDPVSSGVASGYAYSEYHVDNSSAAFQRYASTFTLLEGVHSIDFRSYDNVGNREAARNVSVRVDGTPPVSSISIGSPTVTLSDGSTLVSGLTPFVITSTDPVSSGVASGVLDSWVRFDSGSFSVVSASFSLTGQDGARTIGFYSRDNVLNVETAKSTTVVLDATPPAAALACPSSSGSGLCRVFSGKFPVLGSVQDAHFKDFQLAYGSSSTAFILISSGTVAVSSGVLGVWDTTGLTGIYTLRLTAEDLVSNVTVVSVPVLLGAPTNLAALGGKGAFNKPQGVGVGPDGNVYVADRNDNVVAIYSSSDAFLTSYGAAVGQTKTFNKPESVAVDGSGNIYVADSNNNRVVRFSAAGQNYLELKGFSSPQSVAVDLLGGMYVADTGNNRVVRYSPSGSQQLVITSAGTPSGVAVDAVGNIYISDQANNRALKFDPNGNLLLTIGSAGSGLGQLSNPQGIAVSNSGTCIMVADAGNARIEKFDQLGNVDLSFGQTGSNALFNQPSGLALDRQGNLWIADRNNDRAVLYGQNLAALSDTLPPRTTLIVGSPQYGASPVYLSTSTSLTLTSVDDRTTVGDGVGVGVAVTFVAIDTASYSVYNAPFRLAAGGSHTVRYYSVDLVGNAETPHSASVFVDSAAPSLSLTPQAGKLLNTATPPIVAAYSDSGSGVSTTSFHIMVDSVDVTQQSGVFASSATFVPSTVLAQGAHAITATVSDNVGNTSFAASTFTVDTIPPVTTLSIGAPRLLSGTTLFISPATMLGLSASDTGSGVAATYFGVNGGTFAVYGATFTIAGDGTHALRYYSVDFAGNVEVVHTSSLTVDGLPPVTQIFVDSVTAGPSPLTVAPTDLISLGANDLGSGVATTYFTLDASTQQVFGSGFTLSAGTHSLTYFSVDRIGNREQTRSASITSVAPVIVSTVPITGPNPPGATTVTSVSSQTVGLAWDPNGNPPGASYVVAYGTVPSNSCAGIQGFSQFAPVTSTGTVLFGLTSGAFYGFSICNPSIPAGCVADVIIQTLQPGQPSMPNPPFVSCGSGGGGPGNGGGSLTGLAIGADPEGRLWEVSQDTFGNFLLSRYTNGSLDVSSPLQNASGNGGKWSIEFDTAGFVYAIGMTSGTFSSGNTALTVFKLMRTGGVFVSSVSFTASGASAMSFDAAGAWITGAIQSASGFTLSLWRYAIGANTLTQTATYSRGGGADGGFGVRVLGGNVWVDGYSEEPSTSSTILDLALWEFDSSGKNLIGGPYFRPNYLFSLGGAIDARLETDGTNLYAAAVRAGLHGTDLGFTSFSQTGQVLSDHDWSAASGQSVDVGGMQLTQSGNVAVVGKLLSPSAEQLGVWTWNIQGSLRSANTANAPGGANGVTSLSGSTWLAVDGSTLPFAYAPSASVPGTDTSLIVVSSGPSGGGSNPPGSSTITNVSSTTIGVAWDPNGNGPGTSYSVGFGTVADTSCNFGPSFSNQFLSVSTNQANLTGLLPGAFYAVNVCNFAATPACNQYVVAQTAPAGSGLQSNPQFVTCGQQQQQSGETSGFAVGFDPAGRLWEVADSNGQPGLARYTTPSGAPDFVAPIPDLKDDGNWTIDFDTMGYVYAVGTTSGPLTVGEDLAVYKFSLGGVFVSSVQFHGTVDGKALGLDSTGDIWITGGIFAGKLGQGGTVTLGLWKYCVHNNTLSLLSTYLGANGLDAGFAVRVVSSNVWVAGYEQTVPLSSGPALGLAVWEFDSSGKTLLAGPYVRPTYLTSLNGEVQARMDASSSTLDIAALRTGSAGETDLGFAQFDLAGHVLQEHAWKSAAGSSVSVGSVHVDGANNAIIAGGFKGSPDTMGVWTYTWAGAFTNAQTDSNALGRAKSMAVTGSSDWMAVTGSSQPYLYHATGLLPGSDVLISSDPVNTPTTVSASTITATALVTKKQGARIMRQDSAGVTIPPGAMPADLQVTVSTPIPRTPLEENVKARVEAQASLVAISTGVEYLPEGTTFTVPVTLTLKYDPAAIAASGLQETNLRVYYWNRTTERWDVMPSFVDPVNHVVNAQTLHFSLYQIMGAGGSGNAAVATAAADAPFAFGQVYAYPNPSRSGQSATIHVEAGSADHIEIHIYDLSGRLKDSASTDGVQGTFEYRWDVSNVGSGVYIYVVTASKSGAGKIRRTGRLGVIK